MTGRAESTTTLIERLASDLTPVAPGEVPRRMAASLGVGALVSLSIALGLWGFRPDLPHALGTASFWIKELFVLVLAAAGAAGLTALARPDGDARRPALIAVAVMLAMAALAACELAGAAPAGRRDLLLGSTAAVCPWLILSLSVPILVGVIVAVRTLAPTRLRAAGAAVGLSAGAVAALAYSITCGEQGLAFFVVFYGGAIAAVTAIGSLLGPRLLRW